MRLAVSILLLAGCEALVAPRALAAPRAPTQRFAEETPAEKAVREVNSGKEAVELLFKDPEGYKAARDEYDRQMLEDMQDEAPVDRMFFIQAAVVAIGSFGFGLTTRKQPE